MQSIRSADANFNQNVYGILRLNSIYHYFVCLLFTNLANNAWKRILCAAVRKVK